MSISDNVALPVLQGEMKSDIERLESWTKTVVVTNPQERVTVYEAVKKVKSMKTGIVEFFRDSKEKAYSAWKAIVANEKSLTDKLDLFESAAKSAIQKYDFEVEQKRLAEERRLQAIADEKARKEREAAESAAIIQRKKEEAARRAEEDARRKQEEARQAQEKALRDAEQAKTAKARQAAQEAAEKARKEQAEAAKLAETERLRAEAAKAKAEMKDEQAAAVIAPVIQVAPVAAKQAGESTKKIWKYRITDETLIPREYLMPNDKALAGMASGTKGAIKIPGIEFYFENVMAIKS